MRKVLPRACFLGFTGTPLMRGDKNTANKFGGIIDTGKSGFVPGFTDKTSGLGASFQGLSNISRQAVTNYLWEFGDGSTGSGAAPTHDYAKAGSYRITVVEFSGIGSAYPGSGAAPIYSKTIRVG